MHLQKLDKLLEVHIFMRKKGTKNKKYRAEFKISVIMDMRKNYPGYRGTARKYKIGSNEHNGMPNVGNFTVVWMFAIISSAVFH